MDTVVERSKQLLTLDNCFFGYPPEIIKTELIEKKPIARFKNNMFSE